MRHATAALVLLTLVSPSFAQEKPDSHEQAAEKVWAAFEAGDRARLFLLSRASNRPDGF